MPEKLYRLLAKGDHMSSANWVCVQVWSKSEHFRWGLGQLATLELPKCGTGPWVPFLCSVIHWVGRVWRETGTGFSGSCRGELEVPTDHRQTHKDFSEGQSSIMNFIILSGALSYSILFLFCSSILMFSSFLSLFFPLQLIYHSKISQQYKNCNVSYILFFRWMIPIKTS